MMDELDEKLHEVANLFNEILVFLKDLDHRIATSEYWWMNDPARGGFDTQKIDEFIKRIEQLLEFRKSGD